MIVEEEPLLTNNNGENTIDDADPGLRSAINTPGAPMEQPEPANPEDNYDAEEDDEDLSGVYNNPNAGIEDSGPYHVAALSGNTP